MKHWYRLEDFKDQEKVSLVCSTKLVKTSLYSTELQAHVHLYAKEDYKLIHFWIKPGAWLLSKLWKNFNLKRFKEEYSSLISKTLYLYKLSITERNTEKNEWKYSTVSYDHLEHELRHAWQATQYFFFHTRYSLFKKFRLRMEIDAILYSVRDDLSEATRFKYKKMAVDKLTTGTYFAKIKRSVVENEVDKQIREML